MRLSKPFRLSLLLIILLALLSIVQWTTAQDSSSGLQLMSFNVSYGGRVYDSATNQTTFSYVVTGTGTRPDLSHFSLEIPTCAPPLIVAATSPTDAVSYGVDPTTGVNGIKWDLPLRTTETRTYSITFVGSVAEGGVQVAVKGDTFEVGSIAGPSCVTASIDVDKFVSVDGGATWEDPDDAPGPQVEPGAPVSFRFVITNVGNVDLSNVTLSDSVFDTSACIMPAALAVGAFAECTVGPFPAVEGQHVNTATASAVIGNQTITDTDDAYYFSGDLPLIEIEKSVSSDGGATWKDSTSVVIGENVFYRFVITNTGNVPLTNLVLTDDSFSTTSCTLPASLAPGASHECVVGPQPAGSAIHTNTATITATFDEQTISDTDTATYHPVENQDVIIVIEGPVTQINVNVITIFNMNIELDPVDPLLLRIRVGDHLRVEGNVRGSGTTIVIVAVNIIIVNPIIVVTGPVYQAGGPVVIPVGCKLTGRGNGRIRCKGSGRGRSSRGS